MYMGSYEKSQGRMALMHDYFTTTPSLKEKFFAFALVVLGYSI